HVRATVERLFELALQQVEEAPQPVSQLTQDHPLIRAPAEYGDLFSRAVRHDAGNNGRQAEAHNDRAPAIRARGACATPTSFGATSAAAAPSHLKLEIQPHDDNAGN
ncbi:IS21 family transposase, partial [Mesorhizobium caraganae]|nr:IS21 family transposase [Mesorhizobium caraganae]